MAVGTLYIPCIYGLCISTSNETRVAISLQHCINYGRSNFCIGKNVMFCLHWYKCNVEKVLSGQMNNIIESHFIRSIPTVCMLR